MTLKPSLRRAQARRDIDQAIDYYLAEAGERVALRFLDALEATIRGLERAPAAGSPRYAYELGIAGLRSRLLKRFPYIVFYVERDDHIEVWRVLHAKTDIPAWLQEPDG